MFFNQTTNFWGHPFPLIPLPFFLQGARSRACVSVSARVSLLSNTFPFLKPGAGDRAAACPARERRGPRWRCSSVGASAAVEVSDCGFKEKAEGLARSGSQGQGRGGKSRGAGRRSPDVRMLIRDSPNPAPTLPTRWKYQPGLCAPCVVTRSAAATLFKRGLWIREPARINEIKREGDAPSITSTWTSLTFSSFTNALSKATLATPI